MTSATVGWQLPVDAVQQVLRRPAMHALLDPGAEIDGAQDWPMRQAEFWNVVEIAEHGAGHRFASRQVACTDLFEHSAGGGFGVRACVVDELLDLLVPVGVPSPDAPAPIPLEAQAKLGTYVYALRDPRDESVFYVGKGRENQIYSHVWAVLGRPVPNVHLGDDIAPRDAAATTSAKIQRIQAIHGSGFAVEHWIIRHAILGDASPDSEAYAIEQVLIDGLALSSTCRLTNIAGGHSHTEHGVTRAEELVLQYSAGLAPPLPSPCALVKVNAASAPDATPDQIYQWSRRSWRAGPGPRSIPGLPVLVFAGDIVRAVHRVSSWEPAIDGAGCVMPNLWVYTGGVDHPLEDIYVGKSLRAVRAARSDGAWRQHGWHPYT